MIDVVKLLAFGGDGGRGRISFRREKYVPKGGPDGGDGGDGASLILEGDRHTSTLAHFFGKQKFFAEHGEPGGKKNMFGRTGADMILKVPLGTHVLLCADNPVSRTRWQYKGLAHRRHDSEVRRQWFELEKEGQVIPPQPDSPLEWVSPELTELFDEFSQQFFLEAKTTDLLEYKKLFEPLVVISEHGQRVLLSQGGVGGKGNNRFKAPHRTTPLRAEYGSPGERKAVVLELRLLADVGLVGLPNAGKSTLLGILTKARSKVGAYPFTTVEPHLGVLPLNAAGTKELVLADIPGLIAGASQGKGLGLQFLRHIENCSCLQYVLFLEESVLYDTSVTDSDRAELLWEQFLSLQTELAAYDPALLEKPHLVSVNKSDLYSKELQAEIQKKFKKQAIEPVLFSGVTGENLSEVKSGLWKLVSPGK